MDKHQLICRCGNTGSMLCQICSKKYVFHPPFQTLYYCPTCFNKLLVIEQTLDDFKLHNKCQEEANFRFFYSCQNCYSVFCSCIREQNTQGVPKDKVKLINSSN